MYYCFSYDSVVCFSQEYPRKFLLVALVYRERKEGLKRTKVKATRFAFFSKLYTGSKHGNFHPMRLSM